MGSKGQGAGHAAREHDRAERRQAKRLRRDQRRQTAAAQPRQAEVGEGSAPPGRGRGPTQAKRTDRPTNDYGGPPRQPPPDGGGV